jgi:hypothetical protein
MESFLGIDPFNAPVDFAQVKIYGKTIPVGVVLGYLYGMDNLIKMLKVQPRRVPAGQRQNLQSHEFAIQFSDETLIFSKYDDLAAMVFGGFKEYEKATKLYASHTFDKPNVYLNILESQGSVHVTSKKLICLINSLLILSAKVSYSKRVNPLALVSYL